MSVVLPFTAVSAVDDFVAEILDVAEVEVVGFTLPPEIVADWVVLVVDDGLVVGWTWPPVIWTLFALWLSKSFVVHKKWTDTPLSSAKSICCYGILSLKGLLKTFLVYLYLDFEFSKSANIDLLVKSSNKPIGLSEKSYTYTYLIFWVS